jgi:hypothetical protein
MVTRERYSTQKVIQSLAPAAATTTTAGTAVDTFGYGAVTLIASVGASASTINGSNTITITVQESDVTDAGGFANADAGDVIGSPVLINATGGLSQDYKLGYKGTKRYVRLAFTHAGTHASTGTVYGSTAVLEYPQAEPVA